MDFLSKPSVKTVLWYFSTISGQYISLFGQLSHTIKVHLKGIISDFILMVSFQLRFLNY